LKSTDFPSGLLRSAEDDDSPQDHDDAHGGSGQVPIGVSEGDFSTPTRRTRKITKPRGLKALDARPPVGPTMNRGAAEPAGKIAAELPVADPWTQAAADEKTESSTVDEFLSAPPTPVPQLESTPPPIPVPALLAAADGPGADTAGDPTAGELNAPFTMELPRTAETETAAGEADHPAAAPPEDFELVLAIEETAPPETPAPPESPPAETPPPELTVAAEPPHFEPAAPSFMKSAVPPPQAPHMGKMASSDDLGPLADAEESIETSSLSPLALTLAHMAEALHSDLIYEPADEIELIEAESPALVLPPELPRLNTPPPVPLHAKGLVPGAPLAVVLPSAIVPEALAERPRRAKRSKPWYEEIFDENYLRTLPFMTAQQTLREVDFIQASLNPVPGSRLLDVGCGYGRHAIELVQRGLAVTGLDLSLPLLLRAAEESQRRSLAVDFVHGDMRKMAFERQFDGAYCMLTTFGYFDEESNLDVAEAMGRALKPGGRLLLDVVNRDYIVGDLPARIWWEGDGCVVLEEVEFNFNTNRLMTHRSVVFDDGRQLDQQISLRTYCLHDLGKLLRHAGFRVVEVSGSIFTKGRFFGATSRNLLVVAERRAD
jgi:SAM-dependent methyltransferase